MTKTTTNIINLLAGIWLIISPFILNYSSLGISSTNAVILGVIVGIFALVQMAANETTWPSWLNFLAGAWLILSPFAQGYGSVGTAVGNEVILGIIIVAVSLTSALSSSRMQMQT